MNTAASTGGTNLRGATPANELRAIAVAAGVPADDLPVADPAPWRRLPLEGAYNFRDVGGYNTLDGGVVRTGLVYRSDHLNQLTDNDLETIAALGLRRVHDFRLDKEVERQPSRLPANLKVLRLATTDMENGEAATMVDVIVDILNGRRPLPPPTFWVENYAEMLVSGRPMFVELFRSLATADALPALFHCTGGKDRTGIAGMLLHLVLGVSEADALDDFALTNLYRTWVRLDALRDGLVAAGVDIASAVPIIGVERDAMVQTIAHVRVNYGGPENYLIEGGLDLEALARLRTVLVQART